MSLSQYFPGAKQLSMRVQSQLERLEQAELAAGGFEIDHGDGDGGGGALSVEETARLEEAVHRDLQELGRQVQILETLTMQERSTQREIWRSRVRSLSEEHASMQALFRRMIASSQRQRQEQMVRRSLFEQSDHRDIDPAQRNRIDSYAREREVLQESSSAVSRLQAIGQSVLGNMHTQDARLKRAHRKVYDVANTLGLSNTLLRLIERREIGDKWITYFGMIISLIVLGLLYYYIKA